MRNYQKPPHDNLNIQKNDEFYFSQKKRFKTKDFAFQLDDSRHL